jgi:tetratricopeptide (TPR) repeat protein
LGQQFKGRDATLARIRDATRLGGQFGTGLTVQLLHGVGGAGKTRIAVEYAWAHRNDYTALLFLDAEDPVRLDHALADLTEVLGIAEPDQPRGAVEQRDAVMAWLMDNPGWLLILDNVDTDGAARSVIHLLGRLSGGHVLITSRRSALMPSADSIRIDPLDRATATALLLEQTEAERQITANDGSDAECLAESLGDSPLALTIAAAFIRQRHLSLPDYHRLWREARETVTGPNEPALPTYHRNVATSLLTTAAQLPPQARRLLERLAFLAPDPIPASLFGVQFPEGGDSVTTTQNAADELVAFGILTRTESGDDVLLHPLLQDSVRRSLRPETAAQRILETLLWIDAAFSGEPSDPDTWPKLIPLAPHAETVARFADEQAIANPTARLMRTLGELSHATGDFSRAEPLMRRALAIDEESYEESYGNDHPDVATDLNNLAALLQATNRLAEAEPMMRRALAIDEASYGKDHPRVAIGLNNLAQVLQATNRLAEAEPMIRRALAIDEASYGKDHPRVAIRLNNLATLLHATNRLAEAEPLMHRMVVIFLAFQRDTGHAHPHRDAAIQNYASLLSEMGKTDAEIKADTTAAFTEAGLPPPWP